MKLLAPFLLAVLSFTSIHAATAQTASVPEGRILHVSPQVLPGVGPVLQFRTISAAAKVAQPGDTILLHTGTYRETVSIDTSGTKERPIRFQVAPAANVVVTGTDRILQWTKETGADPADNIFSTDWPYRFITWSKTNTHPDDDYHKLIGRAEQVFIDNYPLQQVLSRDKLSRGTFFADLDAKRLYVWASNNETLSDNPDGPHVEAATRDTLWQCKGDYVQVRGVRFRYAANAAQHGAAQFNGRGDVAEDCVFERTNSSGASFTAPDQVVRRCTFQDNGQLGWGAAGVHNFLFTDNLTRNNNVKNFSRGWEAGGDKLVLSRNVVIEHSRFIENRGSGIWFDIGNENPTVRNCLIADNEDSGIFYEISYGLHASDNVIIGNGLSASQGSWGAAAGIALSSSPNCVVERNLLIGNKEGFNFREQGRTTPRIGAPAGSKEVPVWNHDQIIRNNVIAYNRDSQTRGWFDVNDERLWPAALQEKKPDTGHATADIAAPYGAKDPNVLPTNLSLETLHLTFANNLYDAPEGGDMFHWGVAWKRNKAYPTLDAVRQELKLETGSIEARFVFGDYLTHDFRVPANSPAIKLGCYPKGDVPGVLLGTLPGTGRMRA